MRKKTWDQYLALCGSVVLIIALILFGMGAIGCSGGATSSEVTDGDREALWQAHGAMASADYGTPGGNGPQVRDDAAALVDQLVTNYGQPKKPLVYSHENAVAARKKSESDHSAGFPWGTLATIGGVLLSAFVGIGGFDTAARIWPSLTSVGRQVRAGMTNVPQPVQDAVYDAHPMLKRIIDTIPDPAPPAAVPVQVIVQAPPAAAMPVIAAPPAISQPPQPKDFHS